MRALARAAVAVRSGRPAGAAPRCALRPPLLARQPRLLLAMPPQGAARAGATLAPARLAGTWRARLLGARGLAQRSAGSHAAAAAAAEDDTPFHADSPVKPLAPPPPHRLLKYVAAFAVFGLAGNSFGAIRRRCTLSAMRPSSQRVLSCRRADAARAGGTGACQRH
jgi:hypothetical protein